MHVRYHVTYACYHGRGADNTALAGKTTPPATGPPATAPPATGGMPITVAGKTIR